MIHDSNIKFDDDGNPVPFVEFDFAALEADAARRDRADAVEYQRDKLTELIRFMCVALLEGNPSAEVAGRRAYFIALLLRQSPFGSQAELARHLGLSAAAICQQLNAFKAQNPLLSATNSELDKTHYA